MSKLSLADALAHPVLPASQRCKVGDLLAVHRDADTIRAALDNPAWSAKALARVLKDFGIVLGETTIGKHRRRECRC